MKAFAILCLVLLSYPLHAQTTDDEMILANAHGMMQGASQYFEVEGYDVFTQDFENLFFDPKGIKIAKRKLKIDKNLTGYSDTGLHVKNQVFISEDSIAQNLRQRFVYYFVPGERNKLRVIGFSRIIARDTEVERLMVNRVAEYHMPSAVFTSMRADSINFAGRYIRLGGVCRWMSPHNMQCPDYGQMSWSEFRHGESAEQFVDAHKRVTEKRKMGEVLQQDSVDVVFEGQPIKALKMKYRIKLPKLIMGGSNILIIYYVATEVRGKWVGCVMSQYTDDVQKDELAPLLREVMRLKQ